MSKFTEEQIEFLEKNVVFLDDSDLSEEEKEDDIKRYGNHGYMHIKCDVTNIGGTVYGDTDCLLYTSPSPRDGLLSRMPSSA